MNNPDLRPPPHAQIEPKKNLETLIYTAIARLRTLQDPRSYGDPQANTAPEILNCMRILTRLLPYVYEADHLKEWQEAFFWRPRRPTRLAAKKEGRNPIYFDGLDPEKKYTAGEAEREIAPPLGETLMDLVTNYLFFPGFAIPKRVLSDGMLDVEVLVKVWQTGIGSNKSLNCTKDNEKNQMEALRLLIALSSKPMYTQPSKPLVLPYCQKDIILKPWTVAVVNTDIQALTYMTTRLESRVVNGIVCSLLNTVSCSHLACTEHASS